MSDMNTELFAYLNGTFLPFADAKLPVFDLGIMQGATVTERLRTVRHRPYLVTEHLNRLQRSLSAIGISIPLDTPSLEQIILEVTDRNTRQLAAQDDVSVVLFVTAGQGIGDANGFIQQSEPTVCVYTAPLPWKLWNHWWKEGASLVVPEIRQVPGESVSPQIKHRSRLHWFLADQSARKSAPGAQALLLDSMGFVTETSSGNLFVVRDGQLLTPCRETTLPGISQHYVSELANRNGWTVTRANITPEQIFTAEEAFLTSSTYCIAPVSTLNGVHVGHSFPGPITEKLMQGWSEDLGYSLREQITKMAHSP